MKTQSRERSIRDIEVWEFQMERDKNVQKQQSNEKHGSFFSTVGINRGRD